MADRQDASERIRGIVVTEISRQLTPLEQKLDRAFNSIERLYNSNGGPPGFLQTARKEDSGRFDMIFAILEEHKRDIVPLKNFIRDHETRENQRDEDRKLEAQAVARKLEEAERRSNKRIALLGVVLGLLMALFAIYDHRDGIRRSLLEPPIGQHSESNARQSVGLPSTYQVR